MNRFANPGAGLGNNIWEVVKADYEDRGGFLPPLRGRGLHLRGWWRSVQLFFAVGLDSLPAGQLCRVQCGHCVYDKTAQIVLLKL